MSFFMVVEFLKRNYSKRVDLSHSKGTMTIANSKCFANIFIIHTRILRPVVQANDDLKNWDLYRNSESKFQSTTS